MRRLLTILGALALFAACGPGEVGQACTGAAVEDACVDGAICTPEADDRSEPPEDPNDYPGTCRAICEIEANCEPGFACRRVEGSMRSSCQPTDEPTGEEMAPAP